MKLGRIPIDARLIGAILCGSGLAMLWQPTLIGAALGLEMVAGAFWVWARAAADANDQVHRWAWLRRPAQALWLAAAVDIVLPAITGSFTAGGAFELLRWLQAVAVVWAGLELLAALPLARTYSDLPGPLLTIRPWLPAILPAAGFALLWTQQQQWVGVTGVRNVATVLLLLTAILASLRAFTRLQWLVSLRWLLVSDAALAGLLVAVGVMRAETVLLLWLAACGGRIYLLAAELHGARPRRGIALSRLWRIASWVSSTCLAWPILAALGFGPRGHVAWFAVAAVPVALTAWILVGRLDEAPERRMLVRPRAPVTLAHVAALLTLIIGPVALIVGWRTGWVSSWPISFLGLLPPVVAGWFAMLVRGWRTLRDEAEAAGGVEVARGPTGPRGLEQALRALAVLERTSESMRTLAHRVYRLFTGFERRLVGALEAIGGAATSPARDLHTGDAQEYVLFLVGLSVLALLLPLLR